MRPAVLQDREDVAVAREAGERRRVVGRPGLRAHDAGGGAFRASGRRASPSGRRPAATRAARDAPRGRSTSSVRSEASASGVSRSSSESPEPSTRRTPVSGTPACASSPVTTPTPAAVVPLSACTAPSSLTSISAVKLSLTRSIQWTIAASGGESTLADRHRRVVRGAVRRDAGDVRRRRGRARCGRAARPRARDRAT